MARRQAVLLVIALAVAACSSTTSRAGDPASPTAPSMAGTTAAAEPSTEATPSATRNPVATDAPSTTVVPDTIDPTVERPFEVFTPTEYDGATPVPLVVLLHGYGITGAMQEDYFHFERLAEQRGFLLVHPDGTVDADGKHFWNATDACCGFGETVDDSGYLAAVIRQVQAAYSVDPRRIFLIGFSNGGFMSYRMACDHADLIAALVSISGATYLDPSACSPSQPVNVLEIHGTADEAIAYEGGTFRNEPHPGAEASIDDWATYNGCSGGATTGAATLDLDARLGGDESVITTYASCPQSGAAELWTIVGGSHIPHLSRTFTAQVIDFLLAHPKP
ncbi:MAG: PHB depolymerase family esterase [Ilumatobacteraceae bacterium]